MKKSFLNCLALSFVAAGLCHSQVVIPSGTKVTTRLEQTISSASAQEGQSVNLSVTEDIRIDDVVVIPQGATVQGTIVMAQEKRRMGRSGKIDFSIDKVRAADGHFIPLRYTPYKKAGEGKGVTTGVLTGAAAVVFWPAAPLFLLMKGKDATIQKGITVDVFTDADHTMKSPQYRQTANFRAIPANGSASMMNVAQSNGDAVPVTIEADVDGAEIEVDGSFVGNTPSTRRLTPGQHKVTVREGGAIWERTIAVQPGDAVTVRAKVGAPAPPAPRAARR